MIQILLLIIVVLQTLLVSIDASGSATSLNPLLYSIRLPGVPYESTWEETADAEEEEEDDDDDTPIKKNHRLWIGAGREFSLFDSRGGGDASSSSVGGSVSSNDGIHGGSGTRHGNFDRTYSYQRRMSTNPTNENNENDHDDEISTDKYKGKYRRPASSSPYVSSRRSSSGGRYFYKSPIPSSSSSKSSSRTSSSSRIGGAGGEKRGVPEVFQTVQDWWTTTISPNIKQWPKIQCRVEPTTTLKIRKTFRPLKTIIRLGADFNTQLGVWQFKSSWEDAIIGGKLTLAGRELQLTKSWQLSVGKDGLRRRTALIHFFFVLG